MRKLICTSLLALLLAPAALAQLTTNIAVRVTVTVPTVSTQQTTLNLDYAVAKEKVLIEGAIADYAVAKANGQTNTIDFYLARVRVKDDFKALADAYNRSKAAVTLAKITQLLTTDIDLLTASDLNNLATIANKAP